jgi:hypothetical protein
MKNTTIITTVLSIIATIAVGWITIILSANKFEEVDYERNLKVQEHVVRLIEHDIINQTPLSSLRLERLIAAKCNEQLVHNDFSIVKLIQVAELNLLSSDYLDSKQKEIYKLVFDTIYSQMTPNHYFKETDSVYIKNPELFDQTIKQIQNCNVKEATIGLEKIINSYNTELQLLKSESSKNSSFIKDSKYRKYFYLIMWQMIVTIFLLLGFQMFGRKLVKGIESVVYNNVKISIIVFSFLQIIPVYLVIIFF